tara:strand:- start:407 stop:916 length:510 start_codon:yes stop_codon:yes gene_type:complete
MKISFVLIVIVAAVLTSCHTPNSKTTEMKKPENETADTTSIKDTTPKVTGIGGIFFYTDNPQQTKEWYTRNLGIEINDWGSSSFDTRDLDKPEEVISLQWMPFKKESQHFAPSEREFMINYRVQNIESLVDKLKANGVNVLDSIATYDYGKFVHIMDAEGNKIELWEPS